MPDKCPECGCKKLQLTTDGLLCTKCGLVVSENYFSGKMLI